MRGESPILWAPSLARVGCGTQICVFDRTRPLLGVADCSARSAAHSLRTAPCSPARMSIGGANGGRPVSSGNGNAGRSCASSMSLPSASAALADAADRGFGVYVTPSYLLIHRKPLILRKISDRSRATVSLESAWSAKMTLVLAAVWLLLDYPWGLLAFLAIAALYGLLGGLVTRSATGSSALRTLSRWPALWTVHNRPPGVQDEARSWCHTMK
jgi:hypothetical protein